MAISIEQKFKNYISEKNLFNTEDFILLGVSGGIDSVVMCELFHLAKYRFAIAHCNFQLRGKESEEDEKFVKGLARKYKVPFFSKKFNTSGYAKQHGISMQMAARDLRYKWFEEIVGSWKSEVRLPVEPAGSQKLIKEVNQLPTATANCCFYIAIATQLNDEIETILINIIRGTGISGLHGILPKKGKIIRPLLFATRNEILKFSAEKNLSWREDRSNISDKYSRNKIRHKIIPVLKEINPEIEQTISENINRIRETQEIFNQRIAEKRKEVISPSLTAYKPAQTSTVGSPPKGKDEKNIFQFSIDKLLKLSPLKTYLFEFLKEFGFNEIVVEEIISSLQGQPGKKFFSASHYILKDRKYLILNKRNAAGSPKAIDSEVLIKKSTYRISFPIPLSFEMLDKKYFKIIKDEKTACLDYDKLKFPLVLRTWKEGDYFIPFGMKGRKKLSDFLTDKKISIAEKEKIFVLTSFGKIVWVIGYRIDGRFKVEEGTKKIFVSKLF